MKKKVEAGAAYIVTQMFFDNAHYYRLLEECRRQEITVPIIPGLKVLTGRKQLISIPRNFHCEIPEALADEVSAAPDDQVLEVGAEWALEQANDLLGRGAPSLHFYVMRSARAVNAVVPRLGM